MKWIGKRESGNIEDRRSGGGGLAIGGGVTAIIAIIFSLITGQNPMELLGMNQSGSSSQQEAPLTTDVSNDANAHFVATVLAQTEDVWTKLLSDEGVQYRKPTVVLFSGGVQSACGNASAATGPFYCPGDEKVYIDLSFYDDLKNKFGAPGDFAMAYVVAHEVGHHIQNILGTSQKLEEARGNVSQEEYNRLSVKLELQADFLAGAWAHHAQKMNKILEEGDIEEALNAANAIGDDRLQKESQGRVVPDAFTHGSSAQRVRWFKKGYETGDITQGDTFNTTEL